MHARRSIAGGTLALTVVAAMAALTGCRERPATARRGAQRARPVQAAMGTAVDHVTERMSRALEPSAATAPGGDRALALPSIDVQGQGATRRLAVRPDDTHRDPSWTVAPNGFAVAWTDRAYERVIVAMLDANGQPVGAPSTVRTAHSDEEEIHAPSIVSSSEGLAVSWADPGNGRVRFARLDASGHRVGRAQLVHDGLSMPMQTRLAWSGRDFGVAVALHEGVYFARLDGHGDRAGDGVLVAEGAQVAGIDDVTVDATGFAVRWHDADESGAAHAAHVGRDGAVTAMRAAHSHANEIASR